MKNFARALRLSLAYRWNLCACLLTALIVAGLWAGSLTAVFPVVDVIMTDRALPEWIDGELADHTASVADLDRSLVQLESRLADAAGDSPATRQLAAETAEARYQRDVHAKLADKYRWVAPYAHRYLPTSPFETLLVVLLFVLVATLLKSLFRVAHAILVARMGCKISFQLRNQFYGQMLRLDMKSFDGQGHGDLMNRCTTDLNWLYAGTRTVFGEALLEPLKMIACFTVAAWVSWRLLLITMIIAPLAALLIHWLAKSLKRAHRKAMQELSAIFEVLTETLGAMKLIKAFTMEAAEQLRFHDVAKVFYNRQMKTARYNALVSPLTELLGVFMILLASIAGGYLVLNRQTHLLGVKISDVPLTHGLMSVFFAMMAGMADPARRLSNFLNRIQQAVAAADRIYEVLDREPTITDPETPQPLPKLTEKLVLHDVDFRYTPEKPVLRGVNLEVQAGETLAIVGPNGCGKSTLLNLIPRFYDPVQGAITLNGVDLRAVRKRDLRLRIGLVNQQTLLLNESVAFNIAYGSPAATPEAVEAAARQAQAYTFITEKLSDGFQTVVGPGGNRLSGGQRQRIALARAILRDPEILILDEATSQIDLESEQIIHQVLKEFLRTRTALVVTHRMSTISLADRVVVMNRGEILDVGTHDELLVRCDLYARLAYLGNSQHAA